MTSFKRQLLLLVLSATLPMLLLAVALTSAMLQDAKAKNERRLLESARLVSRALDAELERSLSALATLAHSESLRRGDLRAFYAHARDVRDALKLWDNVLLLSPRAEHLLNLMRPYGTHLPPLPQADGTLEAARTGRPYVSNALNGHVETGLIMYMAVPVVFDGKVRYVIGATMGSKYWSRWLQDKAPEGLIASIVDRNQVVLARTADATALAGRPAQPWLARILKDNAEGSVRGEGSLNPDVVYTFHRSELSGWHVNLIADGKAIHAPVWNTALLLCAGIVVALLIAIGFARQRAAGLSGAINLLRESLNDIKEGRRTGEPRRSRISDIQEALDAVAEAGAALALREDESRRLHEDLSRQHRAGQLLLRINDDLRAVTEPDDALVRVARHVGEFLGVDRCFYADVEGEFMVVRADFHRNIASMAGRYRLGGFGQPLASLARAGHTAAVGDARSDWRAELAGFEARGILAAVAVPLLEHGVLVGLLVVQSATPRAWSAEEVQLLEQIAERTRFALRTARAVAELRASEERWSLASSATGIGAWEWIGSTNEVYWSSQYREVYGLDAHAAPSFELGIAPVLEQDREELIKGLTVALRAGSTFSSEHRIEHPVKGLRWIRAMGRAAYDEGDQPVRIVGVAYDATERKQMVDALREADRRKDEFLATLSHELRNPLAAMSAAAQVLELKSPKDPVLEGPRNIIRRQLIQLTRLVEDLLDMSRIMHGAVKLRRQPVRLQEAVQAAVDAVMPAVHRASLRFDLAIPEGPLYVMGDAVRLTQIVQNLLNNAVKYTPAGGKVWLSIDARPGEAQISVRDTGIGIHPEYMPRLFQMFSQSGHAVDRAQGGLGIGLALVRGLVELHGGSIEARSEGEGQGSEFVVRLPTAIATIPAAAPEAAGTVSPLRVLVADDNVDAADSIAALLRILGHQVQVAYDGIEAVQSAAAWRPDVALLDIGMPRMDGHEAAARIRVSEWGTDMRLIALTGWGQERDKQLAREAGFDLHLTKPVDLHELEAALGDSRPAGRSARANGAGTGSAA